MNFEPLANPVTSKKGRQGHSHPGRPIDKCVNGLFFGKISRKNFEIQSNSPPSWAVNTANGILATGSWDTPLGTGLKQEVAATSDGLLVQNKHHCRSPWIKTPDWLVLRS
jgi:hypothetical protein